MGRACPLGGINRGGVHNAGSAHGTTVGKESVGRVLGLGRALDDDPDSMDDLHRLFDAAERRRR